MSLFKVKIGNILLFIAGALALAACSPTMPDQPFLPADIDSIDAYVDISTQRMRVDINDRPMFNWKVSTARRGKSTPRGSYGAYWLSRHHKSSLYENAPMPFAIFFHGHYAVHGTNWEQYLGNPASAGCVRLSNDNAETLFDLVEQNGKSIFNITIVDDLNELDL